MPRAKPATRRVHLRRMYLDCRFGQLHALTAFPSSGGFDEGVTVLCLPGEDGLGSQFATLAAELGQDRSLYALDAPGQGNSDGPRRAAQPADLAAIAEDLLDQLRLRQVDLVASGAAAAAAVELAALRAAEVRRVVLLGAPAPGVHPAQPLKELAAGADAGEIRQFLDEPA